MKLKTLILLPLFLLFSCSTTPPPELATEEGVELQEGENEGPQYWDDERRRQLHRQQLMVTKRLGRVQRVH